MTLYALLGFLVLFLVFWSLNLLVLFCQVMRDLEEQKARQRRKNIFNAKKGGG